MSFRFESSEDDANDLTLKIKSKSGEQEGIQKKTFTKWVNAQYKKARANVEVKDIFKDFRDGTRLILLLEILTGKKLKKEKGRLRVHHLNNVGHVLEFLQTQKIKLVNIRNEDIVNGNAKLTLGLLWSIISHYQLRDVLRDVVGDYVQDMSKVEKTLLAWCKQSTRGYEGVNITNFSTSWRNGLAFNALIHRHRPDLFEYKPLLRNSSRGNLEHAFNVANMHLGVPMLLDAEDVDCEQPDKKSIMMYLTSLFDILPHKEIVLEDSSELSSTSTETLQSSKLIKITQNTYEAEPGEETTSSQGEWEDYNDTLGEVLAWLEQAEKALKGQAIISKDVDEVKDQFHEHEYFMIDLTNHQSNIGSVLEFGNQLISEGIVGEKEEHQIRDQMIMLNDRWEALRLAAMDRQSKLHEQLMDLQQRQIDELASWLTSAEAKIEAAKNVGSDLEIVKKQIEEHKRFQDDLEAQQQKVNSLTHMVVVVDDNANDNATAELEEQLGMLGERWSTVCKWTEERWEVLQVLNLSWQQYIDEELRLNEWLASKESEVEEMKRIDATDIEDVRRTIKSFQKLEMEMARQQSSFQDFNDAAQKVAEHVEEDSPSVKQIQDRMEEFNERWNALTSQVTQRLTLLRSLEIKLQHFRKDMDERVQWMNDTQTLLNSPMADATVTKGKDLGEKKELIQSLDSAVKKRKTSITKVTRKAEEIITESKSVSYRTVTLEQLLVDFNTRWERLCSLLEERKKKLSQASQDQKIYYIIEIITILETVIIEAERELDQLGPLPEDETRIQEQKRLIKTREEDLLAKQHDLDELTRKYSELEVSERPPDLERKITKFKEKWTKVLTLLANKTKSLNTALESGPPKQYVDSMDELLKLLKEIEDKLSVEFKLTDTAKLEEQLASVKEMESNMKSNQKTLDQLNNSVEKVTKSLSKPKADQLRRNITSLNDKWREITLLIEKRVNQISKGINQTRQFQSEIAGLMKWVGDVESFIHEQVVDGDTESLEVQLDQCEALQADIGKLQRKMDSLQETGNYITNKSDTLYAAKVKHQLNELQSSWDTAVKQSKQQKEKLTKALSDAEKLNQEIKRLETWMKHARSGIEDDESTLQHADVTQERLDHYKEVLQEVSKNNPTVASINTSATKLIDRSDKTTAHGLREKIKTFNTEWAELKALLNKKQQDVLKLQAEIKTFNRAIERDTERLGEIQKHVQVCHESVGKDNVTMEKCLMTLQSRMKELDESGPSSPSELGQQLINKKVAMVTVKQKLHEYQNLLGDLKERVKKIEQILQDELGRREKSKKDIGVIKIWITKTIQVIERKLNSSEPVDVTTIEELKRDFSEHESMIDSLEKHNRELLTSASDKQKKEVNNAMDDLHEQWKIMKVKFEELKARPSREMESEFVSYHGQIMSTVDGMQRSLKKIRLTSSDPRDIKNQLDECKKLREDNEKLSRTVETFKRTGQKILAATPDEAKRSGIEKRVNEVVQQHSEMESKLKKKEKDFNEAVELSELVDKNMGELEKWLKETALELNKKIQGGFPSDVDAELKWNKNLIHQLTRKMAEVQSMSQKGRELVDLSETAQLDNLEDRINHVNEVWEDLSSLAEKRQTTLLHQKKQVSEYEKSVDELNVWLENVDKALGDVNKNEIGNNYNDAKRQFDRIKIEVETKQPQYEEMKSQSSEFVKAGTHIMEPYRRLLERRWDNVQIKLREMEYALKNQKEDKEFNTSQQPIRGDVVTTSKVITVQSSSPMDQDEFWWKDEEKVEKTPDDLQKSVKEILIEIRTIQEITEEIVVTPRAKHDVTVEQKIKTTNRHIDDLQPKIDRVLIAGRSILEQEPDRVKQDETREELLKLSGQWLKLCDVHSKKTVKINPQWYQYRSNVPSTKIWVNYMDKHLRYGEPNKRTVIEDDDLHKEVLEIVEKKVDDLQERGVESVPEKDVLIMRKKLNLINNRFDHYKKPQGYKICVYTGDDKDAGTTANVYLKLFGTKGRTEQLHLRKSETNDVQFQPGQVDVFTLDGISSVGDIEKLRVWHDNSGMEPAWKLRSVSVQDRATADVYLFNCYSLLSKDEGSTLDDIKCTGKATPKEAEDAMMGRHKLLSVTWRQYTAPKERHFEEDETNASQRLTPGWKFVDEIKQVFEKIRVIENDFSSPELHGGDYEDFSKQEDKIKSIGDDIETVRPQVDSLFDRSEDVVKDCNGKEAEAIEQALDKVQLRWNKLNRDYKLRKGRWENAVKVWQHFHKNIKDLTLWINDTEKTIRETKKPNGDLDIDFAKQEQASLEQGIADHQGTVTTVNTTGDEIIKHSSVVESEILRDKLDALYRRWKIICTEVADRRERFREEDMEYEEFADECRDLTLWMNDVEVTLAQRDPSPADRHGLQHQEDRVKDIEEELLSKEETVKSIRKTGQRLQTKAILSQPSQEDVKRRLDAIETHWQRIKLGVPRRRKNLDDKLANLAKFTNELDELCVYTSTTRDILDTQASLGKTPHEHKDIERIRENFTAHQPLFNETNATFETLREESMLSTTAIPSSMLEKWRKMNNDWETIGRHLRQPRMIVETNISVTRTQLVQNEMPDILVTQPDEEDTATPWPKFDKAVSELHDWLVLVEGVIKNQRIMLGNVEEMQKLTNKQKQSVEDELRSKQYLIDDISTMSYKLEEETTNSSHKRVLRDQIDSLKKHWKNVQRQSDDWHDRIDLMWDIWGQYEQLKNELEAWLTTAEQTIDKAEKKNGNTVAELEKLLEDHKVLRDEIEMWRPRVDKLNALGEELIAAFPEHNPSDVRLMSHRDTQRYNNLVTRSNERKDKLQDSLTRLIQFHENMITSLTWLTSTESKIAELDSAVDAAAADEQPDIASLKTDLKQLEGDINDHQDNFASLNETGQIVMTDLSPGEVLTALQSKLDDMNDRWNSLNARMVDVGDKLDGGSTEWRQLFLDLQGIVDWIERAIRDLESQKPVGDNVGKVNDQNETHQTFKNKLNVQRLVIDRALESGKRHLENYDTLNPASPSRAHLAENLRNQVGVIKERWPVLIKNSDSWQITLDEALRLLQLLEKDMNEVDVKLREAENYSSEWQPVTIEHVQEQEDNMKHFHRMISPFQEMFDNMDSVENNLRKHNIVPPPPSQNRIDDLHRRWKELQLKMLNRENTIQENITEYDMNVTQEPLQASVLRPWERAISANKVPYYINHKTETTQWDHPMMTDLYHQLAELNDVKWSAYRTAMKLRCIQKAASLDMVTMVNVIEALDQHNMHGSHEDVIGVSEMVKVLTDVFDKLENKQNVDIPLSIDLTLNWLLNVYDSGRIGKIRELSFKVGLICMSQGPLDDKYKHLFSLVSDPRSQVSPKKLGLLLHDQLQIPRQLGEAAAFGGSNIEPSVRSCFERMKNPDTIKPQQFLDWMEKEPQSVIWIPTLHRLATSETVKHESKCQICKEYPIVGLRFRCLKCFNYDICQSCFFSGRTSKNHYVTHPMHQYCLSTTGPEDVKDFFKVVRNKIKPRKYKNKPPKHLGYLPVQTVMEGTNLETPSSPLPGNNQDMHNKLGMYANRLADLESNANYKTPQKKVKRGDNSNKDEHKLISRLCKSLENGGTGHQPRSPTQILMELADEENEDLDKTLADLEEENKTLMEELNQLKSLTTSRDEPNTGRDRETDITNEIKLLRQHKIRHESRVKVLEDHNRQLEQQLAKLKQLLEQPSDRSGGARMTPASSSGSMKKPGSRGYYADSTASESSDHGDIDRGPRRSERDYEGVQDPELREVMDRINTEFPPGSSSTQSESSSSHPSDYQAR